MAETHEKYAIKVKLPHGNVARFKLYQLLSDKGISHNRFMRETETGYDTMKRYACGEITKLDILVLDRWADYLKCGIDEIIAFEK